MIGKIVLKDIHLKTLLGVYPEERNALRDIVVNVEITSSSVIKAGISDNVEDALDYDKLIHEIETLALNAKFELIESLALAIFNKIKSYKAAEHVWLSVDKPKAVDICDSSCVVLSD